MDTSDKYSEFNAFVEEVKSKLPVNELYTKLTGEQFTKIDGRYRAKVVWREDRTPSLCYYPDKNLLTDFTVKVEGSDKDGESYNPLHILMRCGKAISFSDALRIACEMTNTQIPDKFFKKRDDKDFDAPFNLGKKILEVWQACKDNMDYFLDNPNKRPASMIKFFEERKIPFDKEFINTLNLGICPDRQIVVEILKDSGIVKKNKKGEEEDFGVYRKELSNNALVFPLYNVYGGLCGLRFRQLDEKSFAQWIPYKAEAFYNANRFQNRQHDRFVIFPEGEMNTVAFGIASFNKLKEIKECNIYQELDKSLNIIYSLGPKGSNVTSFNNLLCKVKLIQDNDVDEYDTVTNPKDHAVLKTLARISTELDVEQLLVVDWTKVDHAQKKYDLEDFLKYNNYDIECLRDLPFVALPRYCFNVVQRYTEKITDLDLRRKVQIDLSFQITDRLGYSSKKVFEEICKKEFNLTDDLVKQAEASNRDIRVGPYTLDPKLGRINKIETIVDSNGNQVPRTLKQTNFYLQIINEIVTFSKDNKREKFYEVSIVINGGQNYVGELSSEDITKDEKVKAFCATTASFTDMVYYDENLRGKGFNIVTGIMQKIPCRNTTYYFANLGRPSALTSETLSGLLKTTKYCLFPGVSVVNGNIIENTNIRISLKDRKSLEQPPFEFIKLNDDEFRDAGKLFWDYLRKSHDTVIVDSLLGTIFESCTRELQGDGIVENSHGFPLYIEGRSGCFKTTATLLAMSCLGKFYNQNQLISWTNATALSVTHQLMIAGTTTHVIDDLKIEQLISKNFIDLIHGLYGGRTRTGMSSNGKDMHGGEALQCSVIVTSESKPADIPESIAARFLVLRLLRPADELNRVREKYLDKLFKEYYNSELKNIDLMRGFMPRMIAWAHNTRSEKYTESLRKWKKVYANELIEYSNNTERPSDMVTRIVAACEQIYDFCEEHEFCTKKEAEEALKEISDFWKIKIKDQIKRINKQSVGYKIIDILCQLLDSEGIGIKVYKNNRWQEPKQRRFNYPIFDITYPEDKGGGRKLIVVATGAVISAMDDLMEGGATIVREKFEQDLKEMGIIETENNNFKQYPIPKEDGKIDDKRLSSGSIVIDYNKLIQMRKEINK